MSETITEKKQPSATKKVAARAIQQGPVVYIGPDIPGAKQFTVFNNGLPEELKQIVEEKPYFGAFLIPPDKLAQASSKMGDKGSALQILYEKAYKEVNRKEVNKDGV